MSAPIENPRLHRRRVTARRAAGATALGTALIALAAPPSSASNATATRPPARTSARVRATEAVFADVGGADRPGCTVSVTSHGRTLVSIARGAASIEHHVTIRTSTVFDLGSISKQITAGSIQLLVGDGRLSLADEIHRYVPELPDYGHPVTIEQLLHHTSGLGDYDRDLYESGADPGDVVTTAEALEIVARQQTLAFEPGTQFRYSNTGYFLLSLVVERVSGESMNDFATHRIFEPLHMSHTRYQEHFDELIPDRATGYKTGADGSVAVARSNWEPTGDGAVQSDTHDLSLWADELITGDHLGRTWRERMIEPGPVPSDDHGKPYASGLFLSNANGHVTIGHGGSWVGFSNAIVTVPDEELVVVALCNIDPIYPQIDPLYTYPGASPEDRVDRVVDIWSATGR